MPHRFIPPEGTTGDLLVYLDGRVVAIPVGTDGQALHADSGTAEGIVWQVPLDRQWIGPWTFDNIDPTPGS